MTDELDSLELSVRVLNGLRNAGVTTIAQMRALTWADIKKIKNLHRSSWNEIRACVENIDAENEFYAWVRERRTLIEAIRRGEVSISPFEREAES